MSCESGILLWKICPASWRELDLRGEALCTSNEIVDLIANSNPERLTYRE